MAPGSWRPDNPAARLKLRSIHGLSAVGGFIQSISATADAIGYEGYDLPVPARTSLVSDYRRELANEHEVTFRCKTDSELLTYH